jgi:hypothetical protein
LKEINEDPKTSANRGITDEIDVEIKARAHAAASLRSLGGAENIALANQMTDQNTALMAEQKQRRLEMNKIKAQTSAAEVQQEVATRQLLEAKSIGELRAEQEELRARLPSLEQDSAASTAANRRVTDLQGVIEEKVIEDFVPTRGINAAALGLSQEQLESLSTPDGLPRDTLNTLIQQRRIALEDERLEFARTKLPAGMQIKQDEAINSSFSHNAQAREYAGIASDVATISRTPGIAGTAWRESLIAMGVNDPEIYLQSRINRAINNAALGNRPPGPLTEKEWEFLKQGEMPTNASNEMVANVFTQLSRMEALQAEYERQRAQWLDDNRDFRGFQTHWESNRAKIETQIWESIQIPSGAAAAPAAGTVIVGDPIPVPTTPEQRSIVPQPLPAGSVQLPDGTIIRPREQ